MELPRGPDGHMQIGVTDVLSYRECPQRMAWGMKRHTPLPERFQNYPGEKTDPPGHVTPPNAYGSAVHEVIAIIEREAISDEVAIDRVWKHWQHWLEPEDLERMRLDLTTYHKRSTLGYRLVAAEKEMRVLLFHYHGEAVFFRFKVDLLLQHLQNPALFVLRDYKSGRIPKSEAEIHRDLQMGAYSWAVHELYPEVQTVVCLYDQLRYGQVPTQRSPHQRKLMKDWLIRQVIAIIEDTELAPTMNEHCQHCELLMDCRVTHLAPDYWRRRVAALAPEGKQGRKTVVALQEDRFQEYVDVLPRVEAARKVIERFEKSVKATLAEMPTARRATFGYKLTERKGRSWSPEAKQQVARMMGGTFWHVVKLSITALEEFYGKRGSEASAGTPLEDIMDLSDETILASYPTRH